MTQLLIKHYTLPQAIDGSVHAWKKKDFYNSKESKKKFLKKKETPPTHTLAGQSVLHYIHIIECTSLNHTHWQSHIGKKCVPHQLNMWTSWLQPWQQQHNITAQCLTSTVMGRFLFDVTRSYQSTPGYITMHSNSIQPPQWLQLHMVYWHKSTMNYLLSCLTSVMNDICLYQLCNMSYLRNVW